jgi:hypothetical protein
MKYLFIIILLLFTQTYAEQKSIQLYVGEPLGEAIFDLINSGCVMIASPLSSSKILTRSEVYSLKGDQMLLIESKASKYGDRFTITRIGTFASDEIDRITISKVDFKDTLKIMIEVARATEKQ